MKYIKVNNGLEKYNLNWLFEQRVQEYIEKGLDVTLKQSVMNEQGDCKIATGKTIEELKKSVKLLRKQLLV